MFMWGMLILMYISFNILYLDYRLKDKSVQVLPWTFKCLLYICTERPSRAATADPDLHVGDEVRGVMYRKQCSGNRSSRDLLKPRSILCIQTFVYTLVSLSLTSVTLTMSLSSIASAMLMSSVLFIQNIREWWYLQGVYGVLNHLNNFSSEQVKLHSG